MAKKRQRHPMRKDDKRYDKRTARRDYDEEPQVSARNDISWYSRNPNLLLAAGSFPYPYRPGMDLDIGSVTDGGTTPKTLNRAFRIPGVLALDWVPSVGRSATAVDPISIAAKEIYAKVRAVYSGSLDADAPDFIMYLMALDSIFSYIAWLKRLYRTMNAWTPENYALPDVVLSAMGLYRQDIEVLRTQRTELWQSINQLVLESRKFTCPAMMDVFNRHYWMSDNVYTDENSINSQFYMFNLRAVYSYSEVTLPDGTNTGAGLKMIKLPRGSGSSTAWTAVSAKVLYEFGSQLIQNLVAWDDAYTINGYLKRAYEGAPQFIVAELSSDEKLVPVYEQEVLTQIENSRPLPLGGDSITNWDGFTVSQDPLTNAVLSAPSITINSTDGFNAISSGAWQTKPTLSIRSDTPTVADSVVASRLQACVDKVTVGTGSGSFKNYTMDIIAGTEIPLQWVMYSKVRDVADSNSYPSTISPYVVSTQADPVNFSPMLGVEQFDWHPFVWLTVETNAGVWTYPLADIHNITVIQTSDLANLHRICLYSEFNAFQA